MLVCPSRRHGLGSASYQARFKQFQPGAGGTKGTDPAHTPNLDSMAKSKNSFRFDRFYAVRQFAHQPARPSIRENTKP